MKMLCVLLVVFGAASLSAQPQAPQPDRKIVYKHVDGADLELHVFEPPGWTADDRRPVIVFFFGGGWVGGSPSQFYPHAEYFALRGMVALSAQYRTKSSHGTDPFAAIADGKSAVRYVRANAAKFGAEPSKIIVAGGSAGGHVAASTALLAALDDPSDDVSVSAAPQALVLFNPVIDTTEEGYGAEKLPGRETEASPVHHVRSGMPPTIIFHGTADTTVPFENVERFARRMRGAGNRCELVRYDGEAHGFFNHSRNVDIYVDTAGKADQFLRELGLL